MKNISDYIQETSISQKKRDIKFSKQLFLKGKRVGNIKSFGIITAENPEAKELSAAENKKRRKEFAKILKEAHFVYVPVQGHYSGNKENPYLIFNINREALTAYAKRYKQESFIYAEVKPDGSAPEFEYWEKPDAESAANAAKNPYEKKDESVKWQKEDGAEDNYTVIGKDFKFNINFSIFESVDDKIEANIQKIMEARNLPHDYILKRANSRLFANQYYTKHVFDVDMNM